MRRLGPECGLEFAPDRIAGAVGDTTAILRLTPCVVAERIALAAQRGHDVAGDELVDLIEQHDRITELVTLAAEQRVTQVELVEPAQAEHAARLTTRTHEHDLLDGEHED